MKSIKKLLLGAIAVAAFAVQSFADVAVTSLQVTNTVWPAVNITTSPTNSPQGGTNNLRTGTYIDTANYNAIGITVTAMTTCSNSTGFLVVTLGRANVNGSPVGTDFETAPLFKASAPIAAGTNVPLVYTTNVSDAFWANASTHLGVTSLTNTSDSAYVGNVASNVVVKITRKKPAVSN